MTPAQLRALQPLAPVQQPSIEYVVRLYSPPACVAGSATSTTPPTDTAPVMLLQPQAQSAVVGATATFSSVATGSPSPTVQWESSPDGTTWTAVSGATSVSYTTPVLTLVDTGMSYRATFTNTAGAVTSSSATLTVTTAVAGALSFAWYQPGTEIVRTAGAIVELVPPAFTRITYV